MGIKNYDNHMIFIQSDYMKSEDSLQLSVSNIKQNNTISFCARIDTFGKIVIGNGKQQVFSSSYVVIDTQKISSFFYTRKEEIQEEFRHNLKVQGYLNVLICVLDNLTADVIISTESGLFQCNVTWKGCAGNIIAESFGSMIKDCRLGFFCKDYEKEIWGFGDSYFGRWPLVLNEWGYTDWLVDGYSGRSASAALVSLKRCLDFGIPKKIIWALGMNNPDSEKEINQEWINVQSELEEICREKNIELILLTTPHVPERIHKYKNEYIRKSGYRYVDIENAVGADLNSNWYEGLLSEDQVHPTDLGRTQIAIKVAMEIPELKA